MQLAELLVELLNQLLVKYGDRGGLHKMNTLDMTYGNFMILDNSELMAVDGGWDFGAVLKATALGAIGGAVGGFVKGAIPGAIIGFSIGGPAGALAGAASMGGSYAVSGAIAGAVGGYVVGSATQYLK